MTGDKREQYWKLLKEREAELTDELGKRERIAIEQAADAVDDMILAGERDAAILHLDREACFLREVREALNRLCDGTYGACLRCDRAIRTERLSAIPWAQVAFSREQSQHL